MKKWFLICCVVALGSALPGGCSTLRNNVFGWGPTPDVEGYGKFPTVTEPFNPFDMNCSIITDVYKGFSWNGITIGKTSYYEIVERLEPSKVFWNNREGNISFKVEDYYFGACFIGETISALRLAPPHLMIDQRFDTIFDYVELFGPPDLITWGGYDSRIVLWVEQGFVASALTNDESPYGEIWGLVIISPFSPLSKNQWVVEAIDGEPSERCVFDSTLEGYSYDGSTSCCLDPFFGTDEDECGIIEGWEPSEDSL